MNFDNNAAGCVVLGGGIGVIIGEIILRPHYNTHLITGCMTLALAIFYGIARGQRGRITRWNKQ